MERDVDESTIPQETGLVEEAVSFTKGCFLGQELVARLDSRQGRVNRHLRVVSLSSRPELPAQVAEGGLITSVGVHEGELLGLGLLPRQIDPGERSDCRRRWQSGLEQRRRDAEHGPLLVDQQLHSRPLPGSLPSGSCRVEHAR